MNRENIVRRARAISRHQALTVALVAASLTGSIDAIAARQADKPAKASSGSTSTMTQDTAPLDGAGGAEMAPPLTLTVGKSTLMHLPSAIDRISVGNPNIADVTLIGGRELYLLGKSVGATNIMLWRKGASTLIIDVTVNIDVARLQTRIGEILPGEKGIKVSSAADSVILTGETSSSEKAEQAVLVAEAYVRNLNRGLTMPSVAGGGQAAPGSTLAVGETRSSGNASTSRVINMLRVSSPQQVMLEVKVAEVSKTLLNKLGAELGLSSRDGSWTYSILSSLLGGSAGVLSAIKGTTKRLIIDAEKQDGLVKILAEPNIIAISGQEGSFLAGGKIFIPVARTNSSGLSTITLEEKEFGVGLKFTPTVLDGGRINLRVAPEVSELSQTGSAFTSIDGTTAILPSFTTRRAQTTVQLGDGQSFAIAGLIKSNVSESIKRFPGLGEIPVLGALFRSSEFQQDQTELMFIVTPRLVKPLPVNYALPGDDFVPPSPSEFFLNGRMESDEQASLPPARENTAANDTRTPRALPAPAKGGFEPQ